MMKKKIALLTALMLSASLTAALPSVTYADTAPTSKTSQKEEAGMKEALTLVKSRINIPAEFSKFTYSASEKYGRQSYTFNWKKPDENSYETYSVTITGGVITQYHSPSTYSSTAALSPFSTDQFVTTASDWINKVLPEAKGLVKVSSGPTLWLRSNTVDVYFIREKDGVRVLKNNIRVSMNKMTGEVMSYTCDWWENATLKDPSKAISQEEIQKIYSEEITLKPWYRLKYDMDTKKYTAKIVYQPQGSYVYDAFTGKHSTMDEDYAALQDTDKYYYDSYMVGDGEALDGEGDTIDDAVEEAAAAALSPEELAAVEEMNGLLKEEEFKKLMIADPYIKVTDKYLTESYQINPDDTMPSGYRIYAAFVINNSSEYRRYYIQADAKSGSVYSFGCNLDTDSKTLLDVKKSNELAAAAAQYYYKNIWDKYKADPDNTAPAVKTKNYTDTSRTMRYYRYENNIQVAGDYINVSVNSSGMVTGVNYNHTKGVDFGDGKIISQSAALEQLFKQKQFDLNFDGFRDLKSNPHVYLNYTLSDWSVNAKTGKLCDYFGDDWNGSSNKTPELCPYTDIGDSPYKDEIIALYNHGIKKFTSEKLQPKAAITKGELRALLDRVGYGMRIDTSDVNDRAKRTDLAKQFVTMEGLDGCAKYQGIFRSPFKDIKDNDKNIGYIALAYGMGAIDGDANGNFNPDSYVTREYAMHCIYNYIVNNSDSDGDAMGGYPIMPLEEDIIVDVPEYN